MRLAPPLAAAALALALALSSAPASAGEAEQKQALELYAKGKEAYKEGRFEDAVKLIDAAYALHPEPVLLYNLARAHEGLGDFPKAIAAYEKYLTTEKQIADRGAIEQKVTSLKRTVEEQARLARERDEALKAKAGAERPQDPKEPPRDPAKEGDSRGPSPWPWTIAALGAGGLVAGGVLGGLALSKNDEAEGAPTQLDAATLREEADGLALGSTISFIAGGVVLAAGAAWGIADVVLASRPSDGAASLRVRVGPAGASVIVSF